jgi:glycosyltransferase involved in cell wall biosynthesis
MFKLSIVTINFNNSIGLQKTLTCLENQRFKDFQLIVIDGGSTDDSLSIINDFKELIFCAISEPDKGIYNAMNKGKNLSNGDWLLFLNSGDFLFNQNVLFDFIYFINRNKNTGDVLYGSTSVLNEMKHPKEFLDVNDFILGLPFCHQSSFISRKIYNSFHFIESYKVYGDLYFFKNIFLEGYVFIKINLVISNFDCTGISSKFNFIHFKELIIINNYFSSNFYKKFIQKCINYVFSKSA